MRAKRKTLHMLLKVTVPAHLSAAHARREVRTLINEQCNYSADLDRREVCARSVRPVR